MAGLLVVVGGHSRHVGKTTTVERILSGLLPAEWTGVKISGHSHGGGESVLEETDPLSGTQTARYLVAGARRAVLLRAPDNSVPAAAGQVARMRAAGQNLIVESNRLVAHCIPDLVLFVVSPSIQDWKASSTICLHRADALVILGNEELPPEAIAMGGTRVTTLPLFRLQPRGEHSTALVEWMQRSLVGGENAPRDSALISCSAPG
jgi:hypothetical protein